jgi:hypothetical protein
LGAHKAEELIFIQQNFEQLEPMIKKWKLRARDFGPRAGPPEDPSNPTPGPSGLQKGQDDEESEGDDVEEVEIESDPDDPDVTDSEDDDDATPVVVDPSTLNTTGIDTV